MLAKGYIGLLVLVGAAATAVALLIMTATTPLGIGPIGVTAWFLIVLTALSAWAALIAYVAELRLRDNLAYRLRITNSVRRGLMAGGYITILLALSSLRQLNPRDAILLILLIALVEFYAVARA